MIAFNGSPSTLLLVAVLALQSPRSIDSVKDTQTEQKEKRIAIIGGGIGGSFASKYLAEYDYGQCQIGSITIFDPSPQLSLPHGGGGKPGGPPTGGSSADLGPNRQGSRVS